MICFVTSVAGQAFWYVICQSASGYSVVSQARPICRIGCAIVDSIGFRAYQKWPRKPGPLIQSIRPGGRQIGERRSQKPGVCGPQRPKWGRSPLRTAAWAEVISKRSIAAIRRPNRVPEGTNAIEAVLDMNDPFVAGSTSLPHLSAQDKYTRCHRQHICLHSSN